MFYAIDPLYWMMMIPVLIFSAWASWSVKSSFNKYSKVPSRQRITGAEAARQILVRNGLSSVTVVKTRGHLSDHYDPGKRVVRLSESVYDSTSLAAIGVAAHETGHAVQHARSYAPLVLRNTMVPLASFGSNFAWVIIIGGFLLGMLGLVKVGIVLFTAVVIFQVITLPVEFNASSRAKKMLTSYRIVGRGEMAGVNSVLNAAAMTYVAAAASAIVTLLYFLLRAGLLRR